MFYLIRELSISIDLTRKGINLKRMIKTNVKNYIFLIIFRILNWFES